MREESMKTNLGLNNFQTGVKNHIEVKREGAKPTFRNERVRALGGGGGG